MASVRILMVRKFGLYHYEVRVRGVLVSTMMSEQGAQVKAAEYIRKLAKAA